MHAPPVAGGLGTRDAPREWVSARWRLPVVQEETRHPASPRPFARQLQHRALWFAPLTRSPAAVRAEGVRLRSPATPGLGGLLGPRSPGLTRSIAPPPRR